MYSRVKEFHISNKYGVFLCGYLSFHYLITPNTVQVVLQFTFQHISLLAFINLSLS